MTPTPAAPAPTPLPIDFGHRYLLDRLDTRLSQSLGEGGTSSLEPALVAGVFGEWGSGKSHLLHGVAQRVRGWERQEGVLNVVVEFNAWRYEREEHLLIPLLKVAQQALEKALDYDLEQHYADKLRTEKLKAFARAGAQRLSKLAKAFYTKGGRELLRGALLSAGIPLDLPEYKPDAKKPEAPPSPPRKPSRFAAMQEMESLYFDFLTHLQHVTGSNPAYLEPHRQRRAQGVLRDDDPEDLRVNLIFLVDDLDRCLPDKAVEVLESIKLFLEVPGCAFVLALDEEVVERGIAHRYRDYALQGRAHLTPITGAEYLEKLVHLPIRLPRPSRRGSSKHLAVRLPTWFQKPDGSANELAEWVANLTPPVPRKLHRMAELLQLADGMLGSEAHRLGVDAAKRHQWLALACALQLFAPALFRYLRVHGADLLMDMVGWRERGDLRDLERLKRQLGRERSRAESPQVLAVKMKLERLPDLLQDALHNRSGFDLLEVLGRAGRLQQAAKLEQVALGAMLSFVWLAEMESEQQATAVDAAPSRPQTECSMVFDANPALGAQDLDAVALALSDYHPRHIHDYTLPRYAQLENAFTLDEAVCSGDLRVLQNALTVEGGNLLGRLIPDEMVARWCTDGGLRWWTPDREPGDTERQLLGILEPHLSQWAALRLALHYGWAVLGVLGRLSWAKVHGDPESSKAELLVPGVEARQDHCRLPLNFPQDWPKSGSPATRWRSPWGLVTQTLTGGGAGSFAPYILGGDVFGLYVEFDFGGVKQRFRWIEHGSFRMGSMLQEREAVAKGDKDRLKRMKDESPQHHVRLESGYWLADTPCTQALWRVVVGGKNPSKFKSSDDLPVEQVSWDDVQEKFLLALQKRLPLGLHAVLPTEAQWEYACRAGSQSAYAWGDVPDARLFNAGAEESAGKSTTPVKSYPANIWGLYDMHGNVSEWCLDGTRTYGDESVVDPEGTVVDDQHAVRGGSWRLYASVARSAHRRQSKREERSDHLGFRVALRFKPQSS